MVGLASIRFFMLGWMVDLSQWDTHIIGANKVSRVKSVIVSMPVNACCGGRGLICLYLGIGYSLMQTSSSCGMVVVP